MVLQRPNISTVVGAVLIPLLLLGIPLLVHRGLFGVYAFDFHGFIIVFMILIAIIVFAIIRLNRKIVLTTILGIIILFLTAVTILFYLSSNGLWCAQHPSVTNEMCAKLKQFAYFASSENIESWWLTLGDLLAIQRGRKMPMIWEHDIDVCLTPEEVPRFEKALAARGDFFQPQVIHYERKHWYIPIDMRKLGLRARDAEGVNIDVWTCTKSFPGNITQVLYCDGLMNIPGSPFDRHILLTKLYGDYSTVKYEHHETMCRFWNG